jgi:hypothetical protein
VFMDAGSTAEIVIGVGVSSNEVRGMWEGTVVVNFKG